MRPLTAFITVILTLRRSVDGSGADFCNSYKQGDSAAWAAEILCKLDLNEQPEALLCNGITKNAGDDIISKVQIILVWCSTTRGITKLFEIILVYAPYDDAP